MNPFQGMNWWDQMSYNLGLSNPYANWSQEAITGALADYAGDANFEGSWNQRALMDVLGNSGQTSSISGLGGLINSLGGIGNIAQGLGSLYSMWNGFNLANDQLDLARDQFNFSKNFSSAQLNNQINSYNTNLADRARTRAYTETGNENAYNDWYEKNKLRSFNG